MGKQDDIVRLLEKALRDGRYVVSSRLPSERTLAQEHGVNRATVRSAIRSLAAKGYLETRQGSGTIVRALPSGPDKAALPESLAAFRILMPHMVVSAMPHVTPAVTFELERVLSDAGITLRSSDIKSFIKAQDSFFSLLMKAFGSRSLEAAARAVWPETQAFVKLLNQCSLEEGERIFASLVRILASIRHADAGAAAQAVESYAEYLLSLHSRHAGNGRGSREEAGA